MKNRRSILLGVTGSIAAYKACDIISLLRKSGYDVTVVMTKEALEFITPLTLQTVSGNKVYYDMFKLPEEWDVVHTSLADKADLVLIAPASAAIIGKIASGICDDLLSCSILATDAPVVFAPAMNEKMYKNGMVQSNIKKLTSHGYLFIGPVKGHLACGHEDIGHIAAINDIVEAVKKTLK